MNDVIEYDLTSIAEAIATRECSAEEVTAWSLGRLQTIGQSLNPTFRIDHDAAQARVHTRRLSIVGRRDRPLLLQAADAFQCDTDWHRRLPPVH